MTPRIVVNANASPAARRWRSRRAITGLSLLVLVAANTLRVGAIDHLWPLAIGINLAFIAAVPAAVLLLRRRDVQMIGAAPGGTLFAAGCSLSVRQLMQPRFQSAAEVLKRGRWMTGCVSGRFLLTAAEVRIVPSGFDSAGAIVIDLDDVTMIQLSKLPAKANVAGVDFAFSDGSALSVEVRQQDRLRVALAPLATVE